MLFAVILSVLLAVFMIAAGAVGTASPVMLVSVVRPFITPRGLRFAIALRLIIAAAFWFAAPLAHSPMVMRLLAVMLVAAAGLLLILGYNRISAMVDWWLARAQWVMRLMASGGIVFGLVVLWALFG